MKFTDSLRAKKQNLGPGEEKNTHNEVESYHGQILEKDDEAPLDDWFVGKLKCKKHIDEEYRS
jgi:hypothetical protein